jgi:glycogen(starch) synthase
LVFRVIKIGIFQKVFKKENKKRVMRKLKVLMLGWEYPPYVTGGLGTHCDYLTKALAELGVKVFFVTLHPIHKKKKNLEIIGLDISQKFKERGKIVSYGKFIDDKTRLYAERILRLLNLDFDIIHSQDWPPMKAALKLKAITGKPLIQTIHSTEYDKKEKPKLKKVKLEKEGMMGADKVIAVSRYTKNLIVSKYGIPGKKVKVIYNAIKQRKVAPGKRTGKTRYILFLGRLKYQKGIPFLIKAADMVLKKEGNVKFLIAGGGFKKDVKRLRAQVQYMGWSDKIIFLGYVKKKDYYYRKAYLFVMPSVSEPFGIVPLEAMSNGTPALISRQSGVSEIIKNCVKFNYWDTKYLARKIIYFLNNDKAYNRLRKEGSKEIRRFTWNNIARDTLRIYKAVLSNVR